MATIKDTAKARTFGRPVGDPPDWTPPNFELGGNVDGSTTNFRPADETTPPQVHGHTPICGCKNPEGQEAPKAPRQEAWRGFADGL